MKLGRRILLAVSVGWVPLVLLTLFIKPDTIGGLVKDYTVNFRMLIAVPILLAGQVMMDNVLRTIVGHIRDSELLLSPEQEKMDLTISRLIRLRDSSVGEVVIVVLVYANVSGSCFSTVRWAVSGLVLLVIARHLEMFGSLYTLASWRSRR